MVRRIGVFFLAWLLVAAPVAQGTDMPEEAVGATTDDATMDDEYYMQLYDSQMLMRNPDYLIGAFRFTTVPIPAGATITSASLSVRLPSAAHDCPHLRIHCQDADNPGTFTTGYGDLADRDTTDASVDWDVDDLGAGWEITPDLTDIVQEVVDRGGWESGNAIVFLFRLETDCDVYVYAYDQGSAYAALFNCSYTTEGPPAAFPSGRIYHNTEIRKMADVGVQKILHKD